MLAQNERETRGATDHTLDENHSPHNIDGNVYQIPGSVSASSARELLRPTSDTLTSFALVLVALNTSILTRCSVRPSDQTLSRDLTFKFIIVSRVQETPPHMTDFIRTESYMFGVLSICFRGEGGA